MDIEEGRVSYSLYLKAIAYSNLKSKVTPFLEDDAVSRAQANMNRKKQLEEMKRRPMPKEGKSGPVAKLVPQ